jgi:hypothetical protein
MSESFEPAVSKCGSGLAIAITSAALLAFSPSTQSATLLVCKSGCVYTAVQAAIDAARSKDTIQIGPGTYFETLHVSGKSLTLLGGGEDVTVLDGNYRGAVISDVPGSSSIDNSKLNVAGLTVTHGSAGGIVLEGGTLNLSNSIVDSNTGPGVSLTSAAGTISKSIVSHNKFIANNGQLTGSGGGVFVEADSGSVASVKIVNSSIIRNTAAMGGGVYGAVHASILVTGSTIADNTATAGGGIFVEPKFDKFTGATLEIDSSTVADNNASTDGGGVCGSMTVKDSVFARNVAGRMGGGVAAINNCSSFGAAGVTATDTAFTGNSAGANGGGVALGSFGVGAMTNVVLSGNNASGLGGGLFGGSITVQGLFVVSNKAGGNYGGVDVEDLFPVGGFPFVITNNLPNNCLAANGGCPSP